MSPEARFERIERALAVTAEGLVQTQALLRTVAEVQSRTQTMLGEITESLSHYVDAADARMRRIEDNLDGLIRAITAEHSNGKQKL